MVGANELVYADTFEETIAKLEKEGPWDELEIFKTREDGLAERLCTWINEHKDLAPKFISLGNIDPLEEARVKINSIVPVRKFGDPRPDEKTFSDFEAARKKAVEAAATKKPRVSIVGRKRSEEERQADLDKIAIASGVDPSKVDSSRVKQTAQEFSTYDDGSNADLDNLIEMGGEDDDMFKDLKRD
jgi:hypothetical protein